MEAVLLSSLDKWIINAAPARAHARAVDVTRTRVQKSEFVINRFNINHRCGISKQHGECRGGRLDDGSLLISKSGDRNRCLMSV